MVPRDRKQFKTILRKKVTQLSLQNHPRELIRLWEGQKVELHAVPAVRYRGSAGPQPGGQGSFAMRAGRGCHRLPVRRH